jgi:hypothetical protein
MTGGARIRERPEAARRAVRASPIDGGRVLITGASSGIGRELARTVAPRARGLLLTARRRDRLEALRRELAAVAPACEVELVVGDLASSADRERLAAAALDRGGVDVLVNNAGLGGQGVYDRVEWSRVEQILQVDVVAVAMLTHRLLPPMVQRGTGGVLNIGSGAGRHLLPGAAAYVAAKHFVDGFSEARRVDLSGTGVRVTQVCPGPVDTEFDVAAGMDGYGGPPRLVRISAAQCAREAVAGFDADRPLVHPGVAYRLLVRAGGALPREAQRRVLAPAARRLRAPAAHRLRAPAAASATSQLRRRPRRLPHLAPTVLLRSPLHPLLSDRFLLLTHGERRTGRTYRIPLAYLRRGEHLLLTTTDSPWWRNFGDPAPVTVRVAGRDLLGTAHAVRDPAQVTAALHALIAAQPPYARYGQIPRRADGWLDPASLEQAARARVLVRIDCTPGRRA